jgi:hypothetical protein
VLTRVLYMVRVLDYAAAVIESRAYQPASLSNRIDVRDAASPRRESLVRCVLRLGEAQAGAPFESLD